MAVFVFFAATAGAWIVTSYFGTNYGWLGRCLVPLRCRCCTAVVFAGVLGTRCAIAGVVGLTFGHRLFYFGLRCFVVLCTTGYCAIGRSLLTRRLNKDLSAHECRHRFFVESVEHTFKKVERFNFVNYERVFLFV